MKEMNNTKKRRKKQHATIRVGDTVQVISGKDKGHVGKVLSLNWDSEKVVVEGANKVWRHVKPNAQNQQGGRFSSEAPIHYSNVLLYNRSLERGVRVRVTRADDQTTKRRICVKTSDVIG